MHAPPSAMDRNQRCLRAVRCRTRGGGVRGKSGTQRVALLELYTSEGCSSCPPADRWLADLGPTGLAPARVAPLALHVDYWNYIGWTDPFSQARFTERQQTYSARGGTRTVYTPQFILDGREYRGWFRGENFARRIENANAQPAPAAIALRLARVDQATLEVTGEVSVTETTARERIGVYVALYENNLVNDVRAGENRGQRLRHDYVVRRLEGTVCAVGRWTTHPCVSASRSPGLETSRPRYHDLRSGPRQRRDITDRDVIALSEIKNPAVSGGVFNSCDSIVP